MDEALFRHDSNRYKTERSVCHHYFINKTGPAGQHHLEQHSEFYRTGFSAGRQTRCKRKMVNWTKRIHCPFIVRKNNFYEFKQWLDARVGQVPPKSLLGKAIHYTLKANGHDPYWYLKYLFEHLPCAMTEEDFRALLPYTLEKNTTTPPVS